MHYNLLKEKRVLDKIILQSYCKTKDCFFKYQLAFALGASYHKDQTRDTGEPYFSHPISTVFLLIDLFGKDIGLNDIIIGLLHDTLEDTNLKEDIIKELFGSKILNSIKQLTKKNKLDYLTKNEKQTIDKLRKQNKEKSVLIKQILQSARTKRDTEYYSGFKKWDQETIRVKMCDRLHNLMSLSTLNREKINRNIKTTEKYFLSCTQRMPKAYLDKVQTILLELKSIK